MCRFIFVTTFIDPKAAVKLMSSTASLQQNHNTVKFVYVTTFIDQKQQSNLKYRKNEGLKKIFTDGGWGVGQEKENSRRSDPVFCLEHDDGVAADHDHADQVALAGLGKLDGLVQDEVHEGVEASEDALDGPASIDLQVDLEREYYFVIRTF